MSLAVRERVYATLPERWVSPPRWLTQLIAATCTALVVVATLATGGGLESPSHAGLLGRALTLLYIPLIAFIATLPQLVTKVLLWTSLGVAYLVAVLSEASTGDEAVIIGSHLVLFLAAAIVIHYLATSVHTEINRRSSEQKIVSERARLWNQVANRAHEISMMDDPSAIQKAVIEATITLGYFTATISVIDSENNTFRYVHPHQLPADLVDKDIAMRGMSARVLAARDTVIADYATLDNQVPSFAAMNVRTSVAIPMWSGNEIVAVLLAGSLSPRDVLAEELTALELLATAASSSIEHQKLTFSLAENMTRLHSMVENAPSPMLVVDSEGHTVLANRRCDLLFGYDRDVLVAMPLETFIDDTDPIFILKTLGKEAEEIQPYRTIAHLSDSSRLEIEVSASRIQLSTRDLLAITFRDISQQRKMEAKLIDIASFDQLTGLANKQKMVDELRRSIARHRRTKMPVMLIVFELDRYSYLEKGMPRREDAIVTIAKRLENYVRNGDLLARIGHDKFALLAEELSDAASLSYVRRLFRCATDPITFDDEPIEATARFGVAFASPDMSAESFLQRANNALIEAARREGSGMVFADESVRLNAEARLLLESDLVQAVKEHQFYLEYQPVVDLTTKAITGAETLLRWHHPKRGAIGPNDFIPVAEETGVIVAIGSWIIREACHQLAVWEHAGVLSDTFTLSVNVSRVQLETEHVVRDVESALSDFGVRDSRLTLEITETAITRDRSAFDKVAEHLSDLGVLLAIDDFGTGYSSLSMLATLPVDVLKIDKSFIDQLGTKTDFALRAIVTMAEHLGLTVISEGVETQEQVESLLNLGCRLAQGYKFSRPISPDDFFSLVAASDARSTSVASDAPT